MDIKIVGFKSHIDTSYHFDSCLTLLKGPSGAGKTTILQALYWCLFGGMRGIYNNTGETKKCCVTLSVEGLVIYRQKRPELLKVNSKGVMYEDDVGQGIIESVFGTKELWKSCSYIEQKQRCTLLSGSAADRMTLLNQLSFQRDDPKNYIKSISQKLKDVNNDFLQIQAGFTAELDMFTNKIKQNPIDKILSDKEIDILQNIVPKVKSDIINLYEKVKTHERAVGSYNLVVSQLDSTKLQLDNLNNNMILTDLSDYDTHVNELKKSISNYRISITNSNLRLNLEKNIESLNNLLQQYNITDIYVDINSETIWTTKNLEQRREAGLKECQSLACSYDLTKINELINNYRSHLVQAQEKTRIQKIEQSIDDYQLELTNIQNIVNSNITVETISSLESKLSILNIDMSDMRKGLELLSCPECSKPLRYTGNSLITGDREPVTIGQINNIQEDYNNTNRILSNVRRGLSLMDHISNLKKTLPVNYTKNSNNYDSNVLTNLISRLSRVEYIEQPLYSSIQLEQEYNRRKYSLQKTELENRLNLIPSNYKTITELQCELSIAEKELINLEKKYNTVLDSRSQKTHLETTLQSYLDQKNTLESQLNYGSSDLYQAKIIELKMVESNIKNGLHSQEMLNTQKELTVKREKVVNLNNDLASLQKLKKSAIEVECKQVEMTVYNINQTVEDILPYFFNEPISLILSLYKVSKNKKNIKPGLNISIKYKGAEYDNINNLSGGEGDRISLALILSLNSVSNSSIILLDECISSLDPELKESCLNAIKSMSNKIIVCVDHSGVEGFYDQVIELY